MFVQKKGAYIFFMINPGVQTFSYISFKLVHRNLMDDTELLNLSVSAVLYWCVSALHYTSSTLEWKCVHESSHRVDLGYSYSH